MTYKKVVETKGAAAATEGVLQGDKYAALIKATDHTRAAAKVSVTWGRSAPYAEQKISVTVTLTCDQNQGMIFEAGVLGYEAAVQMVDDGIADFESKEPK